MAVSEFKAKCTHVLRDVATEYMTVEITNHGKVIAVVEPPKPKTKITDRRFDFRMRVRYSGIVGKSNQILQEFGFYLANRM